MSASPSPSPAPEPEPEEELFSALADVSGAAAGRPLCVTGCGRPSSVCLCPHLPPSPLPTATSLLVLSHPHELRRGNALATAPLLRLALSNLTLLSGRRLRPGLSPLLDSPPSPVLFLFPEPSAQKLSDWARAAPAASPLLVLVDGTWRQAREMANASAPFLSSIGAVPVSLGFDPGEEGGGVYDSDLLLRKEPCRGCVSTLEAVARALRVLEPVPRGEQVEQQLIAVLRAAVQFQAKHLPPLIKPRLKAVKKKNRSLMKDGNSLR